VSSATLRLEGVFAGYRSEIDVLQDVTLAAPPGAITVIVGPNGAGKSTLLKTVFGFLHPHAGRILLDDRAIGEMRRADRGEGLVRAEEDLLRSGTDVLEPEGNLANDAREDDLLLWVLEDAGDRPCELGRPH